MKRARIVAILLGAAALASAGAAVGQVRTDFGKAEYYDQCAVCHGLTGKGEGSFGEVLKADMPDLTVIAKRNGGVFPVERVTMAIDGRATPRAHGRSDMPIWGQRYNAEAAPQYDDYRYNPEAFVRARLLWLIEYLATLQVR